MWSADPQLAGGAPLKINGIAFDGARTLYTTNYSTGELFAVGIARDGSARPARPVVLDTPMTNPDGIRWCGGFLYVAENPNGLSRIDVRNHTRTLIDASLDQPTSLAFVRGAMWITEGQILRLQTNEPPDAPVQGGPTARPGLRRVSGRAKERGLRLACDVTTLEPDAHGPAIIRRLSAVVGGAVGVARCAAAQRPVLVGGAKRLRL